MIKPLSMIAVLAIATAGVASAEPQGGFPAQRERATQGTTSDRLRSGSMQKDDVQLRQEAVSRRDKAITSSICKGC